MFGSKINNGHENSGGMNVRMGISLRRTVCAKKNQSKSQNLLHKEQKEKKKGRRCSLL